MLLKLSRELVLQGITSKEKTSLMIKWTKKKLLVAVQVLVLLTSSNMKLNSSIMTNKSKKKTQKKMSLPTALKENLTLAVKDNIVIIQSLKNVQMLVGLCLLHLLERKENSVFLPWTTLAATQEVIVATARALKIVIKSLRIKVVLISVTILRKNLISLKL